MGVVVVKWENILRLGANGYIKPLTILVAVSPLVNLIHPSPLPKLFGLGFGVLEALFDVDPLVRSNALAHDDRVTLGGIEGLVAAPFSVVHIFADNSPVILYEGGLPEHLVGIAKAIQDESERVSRTIGMADMEGEGLRTRE